MRILLTGASGFIGQHLLGALLAEDHEVVCAVRKVGKNADTRAHFIQADFTKDTEKSVWMARLAGVDVVINAVGIFRESGNQTFAALHTDTPRALFAACAESDHVHTVIQVSALGADCHASTPYHLSKKAADDYLAELPVRAYIVQPSLVYGPGGASARVFKLLASMPFTVRFGTAPQLVQPIHVGDAVGAIVALLRKPPPEPANRAAARRIPLVGPVAMAFTDYLGALRNAMGMGRLPVLRLPHWLAQRIAQVAGLLPGAIFDQDALQMLDRGNSAAPLMTAHLLGHMPRPVAEFITDPDAERARAKLDWLLPLLRVSIALVWIFTAIVSFGLYPVEASYQLLGRTGIPSPLHPWMLYGAALFDLALGFGTLMLKRRRWLWLAQMALIGFYTVVIAWRLPEFLWHPYGPLTKNLPMLAAIWLLYQLEED